MSRKREQTVQRTGVEQPEVLVRPPTKKRVEKFKEFLWDSKAKTCCTRTPLNWFTITVYYIVFLSATLGIMLLTLTVVRILAEQNPDAPRYHGKASLLGSNPGVNFFPSLDSESPMLRVSETYDEAVREIQNNLKDCLKNENCSNGMKKCGAAPYGYDEATPCIYLRINRLIGWKPVPYESDSLPNRFLEDLKDSVKSSRTKKVWVKCEGTYPKDRDRFSSEDFVFETDPGFDPESFPYEKTKSYLDPIVAFRLKTNEEAIGVLHSISCAFWAKNLRRELEILIFTE